MLPEVQVVIVIWSLLYFIAGFVVYEFWRENIAHKFNGPEGMALMMPGIVLLWPLVLLYYHEYL